MNIEKIEYYDSLYRIIGEWAKKHKLSHLMSCEKYHDLVSDLCSDKNRLISVIKQKLPEIDFCDEKVSRNRSEWKTLMVKASVYRQSLMCLEDE